MSDIVFSSLFWLLSFGAMGWMFLKFRDAQRALDNANPAAHWSDLEARLNIARDELVRTQQSQQALEPIKIEYEQLLLRRQSALDEITSLEGQRQNLIQELQRLEPEKQLLEQTRQELAKAMEQQADVRQKSSDVLKETEVMKAVIAGLQETKTANENAVSQLTARLNELNQQIAQMESQSAESRKLLDAIKRDLELVEKKLIAERLELARVQQAKDTTFAEMKTYEAQVQAHKKEISLYEAMLKDLKSEVGKRTGAEPIDLNSALADLSQPALRVPFTGDARLDEPAALAKVKEYLTSKGLQYPSRVQLAFHTSLKASQINPLVVLAGVSGTGKSALPVAYAEALGINLVSLAVQPGWSGPQDLLGFYNYLERKYKATELARAMAQMSKYGSEDLPGLSISSRKDQMLLVLLDEMNLARIEYYFSDFLSRLEQRRGRDLSDVQRRHEVALQIDIGGLPASEKPRYIFPDTNILFVGTMNEDESTQSLSDKVIDRANVLRFGAPKSLYAATNQTMTPANKFLPRSVWQGWIRQFDASTLDEERRLLSDINEQLEKINRPFGHRVYRAILDYVANYPNAISDSQCRKHAVADQIEQKIIPKLRGLDTQDESTTRFLDFLSGKIAQLNDTELKDAFERSRQSHMFEWFGVKRS